jgi:hypothetical protein
MEQISKKLTWKIITDGDAMTGAAYAFVYSGSGNWKNSEIDDWDFQTVELNGSEILMGYKKLDGAICKVVKTIDGHLLAITKN